MTQRTDPAKPHARPLVSLAALAEGDHVAALAQRGIHLADDLLTARGVDALKRSSASPAARRALLVHAKLAVASGNAGLARRLAAAGVTSLSSLARTSLARVEAHLGKLSDEDRVALGRLKTNARRVRRRTQQLAVEHSRARSGDRSWHLPQGSLPGPQKGSEPCCAACAPCESAFGPVAYLFDLLDLLWDHFGIPLYDWDAHLGALPGLLERLFLQPIVALDCDSGMELVPQVQLGCEVLERYVARDATASAAAAADPTWVAAFEAVRVRVSQLPTLYLGISLPTLPVTLVSLVRMRTAARGSAQPAAPVGGLIAPRPTPSTEELAGVERAAEDALVAYRGALIAASGEKRAALERKLFIDLSSGPCHGTTRVWQLIVSIQAFLVAARTGEVRSVDRPDAPHDATHPPGWLDGLETTAPLDDQALRWMGSYETWMAAQYVLVYTENVLPRPQQRATVGEKLKRAFTELVKAPSNLRARELYLDLVGAPAAGAPMQPHWDRAVEAARWSDLQSWIAAVNFAGVGQAGEERDLLFPLMTASLLGDMGDYGGALDWYRQLYHPFRSAPQVFPFDAYFQDTAVRPLDWHDNDPFDPAAIAGRRRGVWLRHVILMQTWTLVEWADGEYARMTFDSMDRARNLYLIARRVLDAPELGFCFQAVSELQIDVTDYVTKEIKPGEKLPGWSRTVGRLHDVQARGRLDAAITEVRAALASGGTLAEKGVRIDAAVQGALGGVTTPTKRPTLADRWRSARLDRDTLEDGLFGYGFSATAGGGVDPAGVDDWIRGPHGGSGSTWGPQIDPADGAAPHGFDSGDGLVDAPHSLGLTFCVPPNPLLVALSLQIDANLTKLAGCRAPSGEPLPFSQAPAGAPGAVGGPPATGDFGASAGRATGVVEPPRYRYAYLAERARQEAQFAVQLEATMLQAVQRREDAAYQLLLAQQVSELAAATVKLRDLAFTQATDESTVATDQVDLAQVKQQFWDDRLSHGWLSMMEVGGMTLMGISGGLQLLASGVYASLVLPSMISAGLGAGLAIAGSSVAGGGAAAGATTSATGVGAVVGGGVAAGGVVSALIGVGAGTAALVAGGHELASMLQAGAGAAGTFGGLALTIASFQRRREDWVLQRDVSRREATIAKDQLQVTADRVAIARQEQEIAKLQQVHAGQTLAFLRHRFDNVELYDWMFRTLKDQYRRVMMAATLTARMAQAALEFERQERLDRILGDYWVIDEGSLTTEQRDSGLLGAERLLIDLASLDSYKRQSDKRRLQISKTISLASTMPTELIELRRAGRFDFTTLMRWFDSDFPGHYMRLIKSVRVTVVALVPPIDGIHATLTNHGTWSVVTKEGASFQLRSGQRLLRETVALHSPFNDRGLFVLSYDDPMLLPFEGIGVETSWSFEMPRATNRFQFDTIADVYLTLEYTAQFSSEDPDDQTYRRQVIEGLGSTRESDTLVDLAVFFPDLWYDVKNPRDATTGVRLVVELPRSLFPANLADDLAVTQVALLVFGPGRAHLSGITLRRPDHSPPPTIPCITDADGAFFSRVSAPTVFTVTPAVPAPGRWEVVFAPALYVGVRDARPIDQIDDVALVITSRGAVRWE